MNNNKKIMDRWSPPHTFTTLFLLSCCSLYFYFFMEWLFFLTKPSMLNLLPYVDKCATLFLAPLPALIISTIPIIAITLTARWLQQSGISTHYSNYLLASFPALILASCALLLIENFTYTVFQFGMYRLSGYGRFLYTLLFLYIWFRCCRILLPFFSKEKTGGNIRYCLVFAGTMLLLISLVFTATQFSNPGHLKSADGTQNILNRAPNILVFSSDGINARNMSVYGYQRATTPFLDSIKNELLIFENHLTNSQTTTGSVAAFHSGKLPTTTRLIYRPDMFVEQDAYQHLPGILLEKGFYNGDFTVRHYVDPEDINLREGFHYANGRYILDNSLAIPLFLERAYPITSRFHSELLERISTRLSHIIGRSTMNNPFLIVTEPDNNWAWDLNDRGRMEDLKQFISNSPKPFYAHIHMLGTHGFKFKPTTPVFSKGQKQSEPWMTDFYDDAILDYDRYAAEIVTYLKSLNLYENTLIIFTSDHGKAWRINETTPLLFRFPKIQHHGIRSHNSQHTDIAPTILQYLDLDIPDWMDGRSLLTKNRGAQAPIFAVQKSQSLPNERGWHRVVSPKPPFYTLGSISVSYCHVQYRLNLADNRLHEDPIKGHTRPCEESMLPSKEQARKVLITHLKQAGYDTASIEP